MALDAGTRLGPYEVVAQLGVGGMGEVYEARDSNLGRQVAIKVLPDAVAHDTERIARFEREAKTLAVLNHPNIAHIYGLERAGGMTALVMELVQGPTLGERIAQGAVHIDEALPIARQIAEALEAAHGQGIIHRDLKPDNIKVRPDGMVKVLDFGLAKAMEPAGVVASHITRSPTITTPAVTQIGLILGTAAYMSPEQAKGRPADKRSDIWSFGCVLYEMLTGTRAFTGDDVGEVLAGVIKADVDWDRLGNAVPPSIHTLLRRCLRKEPRQRLGDAGAVRIEIEEALALPADSMRSSPQRRVVSLPLALVVGLVAIAATALIAAWLRAPTPSSTAANTARLVVPLGAGMELADGPSVVISPDGTRVAYAASLGGIPQLYVRRLDDFQALPLAGTQWAAAPFFSPDGMSLGFFAEGRLKKVSIASGVVVDLTAAGRTPQRGVSYALAGAWGPDDTIVFNGPEGLSGISASGGTSRPLLTPEQRARSALFPEFLPGGDALLVSSPTGDSAEDRSIDLLTIRTGERRVLVQKGGLPRYMPTGHLAFLRDGALMAVPFDAAVQQPMGTPVEVFTGVRMTNFGGFSCSRNGTCVYVAGSAPGQRRVMLVDRAGSPRALPLPPSSYDRSRFSPSGDKISLWLGGLRCDVAVYDVASGRTTKLTSENDNHAPIWSPDGTKLAYISAKGSPGYELVSRPVSGGPEERVGANPHYVGPVAQLSWSPRGILVFADGGDLWSLPVDGDGQPQPFAQSRFNEIEPAFSPDGRWLAYGSDESGRFEVYVRPFPGPGEQHPISIAGGSEPVWRGGELFFRNGDQMMVVAVNTQPVFSAGRPRLLFTGGFLRTSNGTSYDVSPDGETFVMVDTGEESGAATRINVLINWFEELKRLAPTK